MFTWLALMKTLMSCTKKNGSFLVKMLFIVCKMILQSLIYIIQLNHCVRYPQKAIFLCEVSLKNKRIICFLAKKKKKNKLLCSPCKDECNA